MNSCGLGGSIPANVTSMRQLTTLGLGSNSLTGTLPPALLAMPNLR